METNAWWSIAADKGHVYGYSNRQLFWLSCWGKRFSPAVLRRMAGEICSGKSPKAVAEETNAAFVAAAFGDVTRIKANQMPGEIEVFYQPLGLDEQHMVVRPPRGDCLRIAAELAERINSKCEPDRRRVSLAWSIADPVGLLVMGGLLCAGLYVKALDVEAGHPYSGSRQSAALNMLIMAATALGSKGALLVCAAFAAFCLVWIVRRISSRPESVEYVLQAQPLTEPAAARQ